mmetsp:Transcript_8199/g.23459  ORF Transcript_8199/g.23459 Transcript_8199/m.23459 type:complete len:256 (+) Transcript_8199:391-1158(+)
MACICSSAAMSNSVSNIRDSCTNVQNSIAEPFLLRCFTPAARARDRARSIFCISAVCSLTDFGSQPNSRNTAINSMVSISPLLSASKRSKIPLKFSICSSENPAFFRSFATRSARHASTMFTKASKSTSSFRFFCEALRPTCPRLATAFERRSSLTRPVFESAYALNTLVMILSSFSRYKRIRCKNSRKSNWLLPLMSTLDTKAWSSSRVHEYPKSRRRSASSSALISPDPSLSKLSKMRRISWACSLRKPSRFK